MIFVRVRIESTDTDMVYWSEGTISDHDLSRNPDLTQLSELILVKFKAATLFALHQMREDKP